MRHLPPHVLSRLERLELRARKVVDGWLVGRQASPYRGAATEFAGHRPYAQGDEVRHLDWKVYARSRRLVLKQFHEETHLPCWLVVDSSRSMAYGESTGWSKFDHAATIAACLAMLLTRQQDAPGLALGRPPQPTLVPPAADPQQVTRIASELASLAPAGESDVVALLSDVSVRWRRRGLVVVIGDFLEDPQPLEAALRGLRLRRHEAIVMQTLHGDELTFPFEGMTEFRGLEGGGRLEADPASLRRSYLGELEKLLRDVEQTCQRAGAEYLKVDMREPLETVLSRFMGRRHGGG